MSKMTTTKGDAMDFPFWLIFSSGGNVRLTRTRPSLSRDERAMACNALIPKALFRSPELRATFTIDYDGAPNFDIDVQAASEALKQAIGVDIDLRVNAPEDI